MYVAAVDPSAAFTAGVVPEAERYAALRSATDEKPVPDNSAAIAAALSVVISTPAAPAATAAFTSEYTVPSEAVRAAVTASAFEVLEPAVTAAFTSAYTVPFDAVKAAVVTAASLDVTAASTVAWTVPSDPVSAAVFAASTSVCENGVVSSSPQAAKEIAISDTPPARATFEFFFSQAETSLFNAVFSLLEASTSVRNAPVEIIFISFAPYKTK